MMISIALHAVLLIPFWNIGLGNSVSIGERRLVEPGDGVGRAGASTCNGHSKLARRPSVAVSGMGCGASTHPMLLRRL